MTAFYLETSALVKKYRNERGSEVIGRLSQDGGRDLLATSSFTTVEIEATAARLLKARIIALPAYHAFLAQFAADLRDHLMILPLVDGTPRDATALARAHALRAGDALHLASALVAARSESVVLTTSDDELASAGQAHGLAILDPQQRGAASQLRSLRGAP